jgi:hypothetical protein
LVGFLQNPLGTERLNALQQTLETAPVGQGLGQSAGLGWGKGQSGCFVLYFAGPNGIGPVTTTATLAALDLILLDQAALTDPTGLGQLLGQASEVFF